MNKQTIHRFKASALVIIAFALMGLEARAGNPDRVGQAGAPDLLMNPWARSAGWAGVNSAGIRGIEAERFNIAGLSFVPRTEVYFSHVNWLRGSDININAVGLGQRISEKGVLGASIMSTNLGEIDITTTDQPDGGNGTFTPNFLNIGLSYAHAFSDHIHGGVTVRLVNESIFNVSARGLALDAGIQYATGKDNRFRLGVALRNVGTPLRYDGEGLTNRGTVDGDRISLTLAQRSEQFEMPSLMNIGLAYDLFLTEEVKCTLAGNFTSNSFMRDRLGFGAEFNLKEYIQLRAAYVLELSKNDPVSSNANKGLATGLTLNMPFGKTGNSILSLDYAFRPSNSFQGTHSIAVRLNLGERN